MIFSCQKLATVNVYSVIPLPTEITITQDVPFNLNSAVAVVYPEGDCVMQRNADFLSDYIAQSTGYRLPVQALAVEEFPEQAIVLRLTDSITQDEGYRLTITSKQIQIEGKTPRGVFYGIQTLRKSIPAVVSTCEIQLPAATVNNASPFYLSGYAS